MFVHVVLFIFSVTDTVGAEQVFQPRNNRCEYLPRCRQFKLIISTFINKKTLLFPILNCYINIS